MIDLLETRDGGEIGYRPAVGGAPLNVAVGVSRLGGVAEFCGAVGDDVFGRRIQAFLRDAGVGDRGLVTVEGQTTLAVTSFDGAEPDFDFYGDPRSYGSLRPADLDGDLLAGASAIYCGSIALLEESTLAAARRAWGLGGAFRAFDPNIRPNLLKDRTATRAMVEEFSATADLVKLSVADAWALYQESPSEVGQHLAGLGGATVVITLGADGALVRHGGRFAAVAGVAVSAIDTTGAGDATMAALLANVLRSGAPEDLAGWVAATGDAMRVAALVCEAPGGATAMPTPERLRARFPG